RRWPSRGSSAYASWYGAVDGSVSATPRTRADLCPDRGFVAPEPWVPAPDVAAARRPLRGWEGRDVLRTHVAAVVDAATRSCPAGCGADLALAAALALAGPPVASAAGKRAHRHASAS